MSGGKNPPPREMVDALYYIHETSSHDDMDALLEQAAARGISIQPDLITSPADVAVQVWLTDPEIVRERHAENIAFRQKNFLYYGGPHATKTCIPVITDHMRNEIETALDDWFEQHNRGRGCRVFFFPHKHRTWILVRHGLPTRREASHQNDGQPSIEVYRPQQHDVLIYDSSNDEMSVHANTKGEIKLYLACFGRILFGDENYFPPSDKFDLHPLIANGANSLLCEDVPGIERIRLVEYHRYWGGAYQDIEIQKASDIFASLAARSRELGTAGRLSSAKFKVKFKDSPKERSVTLRPSRTAKYERNEDSELIELWLSKRGFIVEPSGEADAETLSDVVEGAGRNTDGHRDPAGVGEQAG
jgi:hypothetical protein